MRAPEGQLDELGGGEHEDLLTRIVRELDEHCEQLEPMAEEYQRVKAARAALIAGTARPAPRRPAVRQGGVPLRPRLSDEQLLEAVFEAVRRAPGATPAELAQALGFPARERARSVIRPLSRLHRLGRVGREGEGFRVAAER